LWAGRSLPGGIGGACEAADIRSMNAAEPQTRAMTLILEHCARMNSLESVEPTASLRLRQAIGEELAKLLLNALAGDHRRVGLGAARS
jgi:hypothetical protein